MATGECLNWDFRIVSLYWGPGWNQGQSSCLENILFSEHENSCNETTKHQEETQPGSTFIPEMQSARVYGTFSAQIWVSLEFSETSMNYVLLSYVTFSFSLVWVRITLKGGFTFCWWAKQWMVNFSLPCPRWNFVTFQAISVCTRFDICFESLSKIHWLIAVCLWL